MGLVAIFFSLVWVTSSLIAFFDLCPQAVMNELRTYNFLLRSFVSMYINSIGVDIFMTRTVHEVLWGFKDPLLSKIHSMRPEVDEYFGLMWKVSGYPGFTMGKPSKHCCQQLPKQQSSWSACNSHVWEVWLAKSWWSAFYFLFRMQPMHYMWAGALWPLWQHFFGWGFKCSWIAFFLIKKGNNCC